MRAFGHIQRKRGCGAPRHPVVAAPKDPPMITVNFGTTELATACTIFGAVLGDCRRARTDGARCAGDVCRKRSGMRPQIAELDEVRRLSAESEKSTPLFATMPTRNPCRRASR